MFTVKDFLLKDPPHEKEPRATSCPKCQGTGAVWYTPTGKEMSVSIPKHIVDEEMRNKEK